MKIALTSKGKSLSDAIDPRFGRTDFLLICEDGKVLEAIDNTACKDQAHGVGPVTAAKLEGTGAQVVITGNGPGGNAKRVLDELGVKMFVGAAGMSGEEAIAAYKNDELKLF